MPSTSFKLPPTKRQKTNRNTTITKELELRITAAVANNASLNPLSDLVDVAQNASDTGDMSRAVYSLYRVFVTIISGNKLAPGGSDAAKVVRKWVWERLDTYVDLLLGLLQDEEATLRKSALDVLFSLLKHLSTSLTKSHPDNQPQFHFSHFKRIVEALLLCPPSSRHGSTVLFKGKTALDVREHFVDTWFTVHDDIRWCFLREATFILSKHSTVDHLNLPGNLLSIMENLTTFPTDPSELNTWWVEELGKTPPRHKSSITHELDEENEEVQDAENPDERDDWKKFFDDELNVNTKKAAGVQGRTHQLTFHQSLHSLQAHRAMFTRTWLTFLPYLSSVSSGSNRALMTRVLNIMHRGVLPHLTRPILAMDWISACVDSGGTVGLLALNALFIMIRDYNLDYPLFYTRLYAFLDRDVLHLKHRARFFRLTELFLSSTHLPASLLASFVKRLSRLSLTAPPAAIIMIIPLTYNLLKRHPALMGMIHRTQDVGGPFIDPFSPDETNPTITNAIDSSLWELYTHKQHYDAAVSTLARIFEEAFTKPGYSMENFLDHTYGTLIEAETKRQIRKEPALAMELFRSPFPAASDEDTDMVVQDELNELWVFG